jgi:hypothetical protein
MGAVSFCLLNASAGILHNSTWIQLRDLGATGARMDE